jgi:peptidyl-prolyl cis-trans isomerase D
MLTHIRKNTKLIMWVLLLLIVPPFLFFGIENAFVRKENRLVGVLFGKKILLEDFYKARSFTFAMTSLQQQNPADPRYLDQLTWQRLILLSQAQKSGITVSNTELSKAILKNFSTGQFDQDMYQAFVKNTLKLSVFEFEKAYRETILIEKFQDMMTMLVQVYDQEIQDAYVYEKEKLTVRYCEIPFKKYVSEIQISDADIKSYYDQNRESLEVPVQRKLQYVRLSLKSFEDKIKITPKAIEAFYQKNKKFFNKPLTELSGQIESNLKMEKAYKRAQKAANKIYGKLLDKEPFEKAVQNTGYSVETTDFFTQEKAPELFKPSFPVLKSIFGSSLMQPLEPASIHENIFVIVPTEEKAPYLPALEETREQIKEILIGQKAREKAKIASEDILNKVKETLSGQALSFSKACSAVGEKAVKLGPFMRSESWSGNGPLSSLKEAAWKAPLKSPSEVIPTENGFAFFSVVKRELPSEEDFTKDKDSLKERVLARKRQKVFYEYYAYLLKQCQFFEANPVS